MEEGKRSEYWRRMVAEQERSGLPVRAFCQEAKLSEHTFYNWRARLRREPSARFALVEPGEPAKETIELTLATGDRLTFHANPATLRMVLAALRA